MHDLSWRWKKILLPKGHNRINPYIDRSIWNSCRQLEPGRTSTPWGAIAGLIMTRPQPRSTGTFQADHPSAGPLVWLLVSRDDASCGNLMFQSPHLWKRDATLYVHLPEGDGRECERAHSFQDSRVRRNIPEHYKYQVVPHTWEREAARVGLLFSLTWV